MNTLPELDYRIDPDLFTVDWDNDTTLLICNNTEQPQTIKNPNRRDISEVPPFGNGVLNDTMVFYIFFKYGDAGGHLTSVADSRRITGSLVDEDKWQIKHDTGPEGIYWYVIAREDIKLEPGECLVIRFEHIRCNKKQGITPANIELWYGEESKAVPLSLEKLAKPVIRSFRAHPETFNIGDRITMMWELLNAQNCTVAFCGVPVPPGSSSRELTVKGSDDKYVLSVANRAGYTESRPYEVVIKSVEHFELKSIDDKKVCFAWKVSKINAQECFITGLAQGRKNVDFEGDECMANVTVKDCEFTLVAVQRDSTKTDFRTIAYSVPKIIRFEACWLNQAPAGKIDIALDDEHPFLDLVDLRELDTIPYQYAIKSPPVRSYELQFVWEAEHYSSALIVVGGKEHVVTSSPFKLKFSEKSIHQATLKITDRYGYSKTRDCEF